MSDKNNKHKTKKGITEHEKHDQIAAGKGLGKSR